MNERRRFATTWEAEGVRWRRCTSCGKDKQLERDFYRSRTKAGAVQYTGECKPCKRKRSQENYRARRSYPATAAKLRAEWSQRQREYARRYPERTKEARKRAYERLRKDPQAYARQRELARINHRLRREREGLPVRPSKSLPKNVIRSEETKAQMMPALPLAEVIRQRANGHSIETMCKQLGISDRSYREWLEGRRPHVQSGMVDQVLTGLGLHLWDVYPE